MSSPSPCPATASKTSSSVLLVEQEDRRRLRLEDRPRRLDDRLEQRPVELLGAEDAGRDGVVEAVARSSGHVVRGQGEDALELERRQTGMLAEDQRADPGDVRRREAVTGAAQRRALEPRDVELQPAGEELDGRIGLK